MRIKKITPIVSIMIGLFAVLIISFSCSRSGNNDHPGHATGGHADEPAGHMDNADADSHHEADQMQAASPSGKVVDGVRVVQVKARKFEFEPASITVRQDEKVHLEVTSEDVMHGIGIEGYDISRKLPPKETQLIEFTADKPGRHHFHCSVYCGSGHGNMHGELVVIPN